MSLDQQRHDWEELAEYDALGADLRQPEKRGGGWQADELLATGEREIAEVLATARALGLPRRRRRALDWVHTLRYFVTPARG